VFEQPFTSGASVIATAMFVIFRNTFLSATQFNIEANLGKPMLAFMWIVVGFNLIGLLMQFGTCCGVYCSDGRKWAVNKSQAISSGSSDRNGKGHVNRISEKEDGDANGDGHWKRRFGWKSG
jgi:SUR7/PalI family